MAKHGIATAIAIASAALTFATAAADDAAPGALGTATEHSQLEAATAWVDENAARLVHPVGLPGADGVVHGHSRIAVAEAPVIVGKLAYDCNFAVAVFGAGDDPEGVIADPDKPIVIRRAGQTIPDGDYHVVELQTDTALLFTIMAVEQDTPERGDTRPNA